MFPQIITSCSPQRRKSDFVKQLGEINPEQGTKYNHLMNGVAKKGTRY